MESFKKLRAAFMILLFFSSFFLHIFVHGPCCSAACHGFSGSPESSAQFQSGAHEISAAPDMFCPVCAGWLTADGVECGSRLPVLRGHAVSLSGESAPVSISAWLLPSPRAPPAFDFSDLI